MIYAFQLRRRIGIACLAVELLISQAVSSQISGDSSTSSSIPREVTNWIQTAAIPLDSANPQSGLKDLLPLQSAIGNARIVAMGEATHGSREFFQLKHRMLELLVEKMGFTVFGIEANWPESLAVNDFVLNGSGDPEEALARLYFWTWNTEEVLDMIRWMRAYNTDPHHLRKVKFYGFDMQVSHVAVLNVDSYLQKVDPEGYKLALSILDPLRHPAEEQNYRNMPERFRHDTAQGIQILLERFARMKDMYVAASSSEQWIIAQHNLEIVQQAEELQSTGPWVRDHFMAANVKWILDNEGPSSRILLWAHNGHVSTLPFGEPMGMQLRKMYGKDMVVCGFSFDQGAFQAKDTKRELHQFTVGPSIPGSLDAALSGTGLPLFAIDLRSLPQVGVVAEWFNTPQLMRTIGATYDESFPNRYFAHINPHAFDLIFFVNRTTAAHENPKLMKSNSIKAPTAL